LKKWKKSKQMKTRNVSAISWLNGEIWEPDTLILIEVSEFQPEIARLTRLDYSDNGKKYFVKSVKLHKYFKEFVEFLPKDVEEAMSDGVCLSLTGENVEPDGWDSQGFPSLLLALGLT